MSTVNCQQWPLHRTHRDPTQLHRTHKDYTDTIHRTHKDCTNTVLKRKNARSFEINPRWLTKWRLKGVLIPLMILNVTGQAGAVEAASRVLASLLGYPPTCMVGGEARPCTLTLSCWLRGGSRGKGCGGGWLFSCCTTHADRGYDDAVNSIPSSDWKYKEYKVVPPRLREVPQRSVVPTNVLRRRVDDDTTQMDCGLPSTRILQKRIIGGREARVAEFPWQAHVRISEFQCGGVLVSHQYVATAAHCVSRARVKDIAVWLGALDTTAGADTARKLGVVQKILHPLFQFRMTQPDRYDIALLKLSRPVSYTSHILPICLPEYDLDLRGKSGVIAGWGKTDTSNGHTGTNLLRSATVPILSTEQCIKWHQSKQISVEIHSEMICAGHSDGHQDACLGDSGGPLIVLDGGRYYLAGITSAGFGCGVDHQPGIYHNVKLTAPWIHRLTHYNTYYIHY
ncbi:serine protease 27 [Pectinophora gossypiella]|uniref:serine protease 27 n=1 Tax=Pectinophora gossypiella TaxID=13191 RepID=UPI00214E5E52|nr:serine protease 27 [Pectinophora gossypiella]XP_049882741.1 serine protease 27 [Pectinophora gossypiella]